MKSRKWALLSALSLAAFMAAGQSANADGRRDRMDGRNDRGWSHGTDFRHGQDGDRRGHRNYSSGYRSDGYRRHYGSGYGYGYGYRAPYAYAPPYYASVPGPYVDDYYPDAYYPVVPYPRYRTRRVFVSFPAPHYVLRRILDPIGIFDRHHRHYGR